MAFFSYKGFPLEGLLFVGAKSVETPDSFNIHPHLKKTHAEARIKKLESGAGIDWATAEALAIGSLLHQGENSSSILKIDWCRIKNVHAENLDVSVT